MVLLSNLDKFDAPPGAESSYLCAATVASPWSIYGMLRALAHMPRSAKLWTVGTVFSLSILSVAQCQSAWCIVGVINHFLHCLNKLNV